VTGTLKKVEVGGWFAGYLKPLYQLRTLSFIDSDRMNICVCMHGGTVVAPTEHTIPPFFWRLKKTTKDLTPESTVSSSEVLPVPQQRLPFRAVKVTRQLH
jgi:hypothetical protein